MKRKKNLCEAHRDISVVSMVTKLLAVTVVRSLSTKPKRWMRENQADIRVVLNAHPQYDTVESVVGRQVLIWASQR